MAELLELQLQHQSFQWIFRVDFFSDWLVWSPCSPRDSQESSLAPQLENIASLALSLLYDPTLTSVHDYRKNHNFDYMDLCQQNTICKLKQNNLDSILKSRDITLPANVCQVKATVFLVITYGHKSWTIKRLSVEELMLLNCGVGEDSWESLELQGDPTNPS